MTSSIVPTRASDAHPTAPSARGCGASHTRRALLVGAAAAPALALPSIAAAADPHPAWHAEWRELLRWCNTADLGGRELREFPQWDRLEELEELISTTAAVTLAGVRVQLAQLHHVITEVGVPNDHDVTGLANAIATLDRLAGEVRHV
jgi:hypothetical protein